MEKTKSKPSMINHEDSVAHPPKETASKAVRIGYYASLGLFTLLMLFSVYNYFFNNPALQEAFTSLGFPTFLIYPMAIAKLLGLVAIWTKRSIVLKEWAYAGFFFNILLAAAAHINVSDGRAGGAIVALVLLLAAYFLEKKVFPRKTIREASSTVEGY